MKQMFRGIISDAHIQLLARDVWPTFVTRPAIAYSQLYDAMVAWGQLHGLEFEADSVIGWWVLYQRDVEALKPTSEAAEFWYDAKAKYINRYDSRGYHDMLIDLLPIAALKKKLGKQSPGK